jgi:hypothetical protein
MWRRWIQPSAVDPILLLVVHVIHVETSSQPNKMALILLG